METIESGINGLIILKPTLFQDKRGYFMESFQDQFFKENFSNFNFIQENECSSCFGVLRGLHFQNHHIHKLRLFVLLKERYWMWRGSKTK